jgi:flagellar motor switch protein FliM
VPARDTETWRQRRSVLLARHPERLPALTAALWAEIGHCELSTTDLRSLHPGDVVLVETLTARPDKGEGGTAKLKVAAGQMGHWEAAVAFEGDAVHATLQALVLGPEAQPRQPEGAALPPERPPAPTTPWDEPENTAVTSRSANPEVDAAELLNDVPLHVAVELGRAAVTAEEIVALRVGQVVTLRKSPGDPVDLSVNGKVVAHGELVEVEGQLGVRITSLSS